MHQDDLIEMEVSDFYKSVLLAVANGFQAPWENCYVCDPKNYDELSIISVEQNTITFRSLSGIPRQVPINVLSQWGQPSQLLKLSPTAQVLHKTTQYLRISPK